uniref:Uncharacterized protein n=1 Tax=Fibrocapsa japonica TaxID=94617 RepID=A0A7S2V4Q1_9STRA|mmetsp:Transcript_6970/g.10507  ORF Transcript_6970/g.10507 Transcript_6970/m.10507 type:complete len:100 (+) Transcript_6970:537-836(+)
MLTYGKKKKKNKNGACKSRVAAKSGSQQAYHYISEISPHLPAHFGTALGVSQLATTVVVVFVDGEEVKSRIRWPTYVLAVAGGDCCSTDTAGSKTTLCF